MKALLIDNYDSFVHNLARYVRELSVETIVKRNDEISLVEIAELQFSHIIISPGPKTPNEAGISLDVIRDYANKLPILGVCLGHQAIAQVFGGRVVRAKFPMHGKSSAITHDNKNLFHRLENPFMGARYHSLIVSDENFPEELVVTARCDKGEIMALQHCDYSVYGVQFHPESVLTRQGYRVLKNFLEI